MFRSRRFPVFGAALLAGVLVGSLAAVIAPGPAEAVTFLPIDYMDNTPRRVVKVCIESTPNDVSPDQAEVLLNRAIAHWEVTGGIDGYPAVDLSQDYDCDDNPDIRVIAVTSGINGIAQVINPDNEELAFHDGYAWWDGIGSRQSSEYSYEGILTHELGHTFGITHAGTGDWTYDGGALPTMTQCGDPVDTQWLDTLQQDDWGAAVSIGGHSTGKTPFWNANPGFERGTSYWYRNSSGITASSTYKHTGGLGVRIPAINGYIYMTSVYDPWHPPAYQMSTMSIEPALHVRTDYRHNLANTTGGLWVQYNWRYLRYNYNICKTETSPSHTSWSGVTTALSCGDRGTSWSWCDGSVSVTNSSTNDATVFRAYVKSRSSWHLYIDRTGAYGGTAW